MSRYIDADAFVADSKWCGLETAEQVLFALDHQPSIDIVRCSECVYCNVQNTKYLYAICERHGIEFKPFEDDTRTHGCAWGISRSEKPNNCEHITEDGVTCAKYPACDDCLDNPLNKVKGSERLVKGSEEDCFLCKWLGDVDVCGRCRNRNLFAEADTEPTISKMEQVGKE